MPRHGNTEVKTTAVKNGDEKFAAAAESRTDGRSFDELRASLMRKLEAFAGDWRRCPQRTCWRARACTSPDGACFAPPRPQRAMSPEQEAQMMAALQRLLKQRLAELDA